MAFSGCWHRLHTHAVGEADMVAIALEVRVRGVVRGIVRGGGAQDDDIDDDIEEEKAADAESGVQVMFSAYPPTALIELLSVSTITFCGQ